MKTVKRFLAMWPVLYVIDDFSFLSSYYLFRLKCSYNFIIVSITIEINSLKMFNTYDFNPQENITCYNMCTNQHDHGHIPIIMGAKR